MIGFVLAQNAQPLAARAITLLPTPAGVGANIQVSPADGHVYETVAAAIDPNDPAAIVAGSNSWDSASLENLQAGQRPVAIFRSHDAGATWSTSALPPPPPTGENINSVFPSLTIDGRGVTYAGSWGAVFGARAASTFTLITGSADYGATWSPQIILNSGASGSRPLVATDVSASRFRNRAYAAFGLQQGPGAANPSPTVALAHSDDGGSWPQSTVVPLAESPTNPSVGGDGTVYLALDDPCAGTPPPGFGQCIQTPGALFITKSMDGGATFSTQALLANTFIGSGTTLGNYGNVACGGSIGINPSLAVDRSGGAHNGNLYAIWADDPVPPHVHIFFARSTDGGTTWSMPRQIDSGNPNDAWSPAIAVDEAYGTITLSWYDRRDDPNNKLYRIYYTESTDGGATFLPAQVPVSSVQADPTLECTAAGNYAAIVASGGTAHPFWTDSRTGTNAIFTAAVSETALLRSLGRSAPAPAPSTPWKPRQPPPPPLAQSISSAAGHATASALANRTSMVAAPPAGASTGAINRRLVLLLAAVAVAPLSTPAWLALLEADQVNRGDRDAQQKPLRRPLGLDE